MNFTLAQFPDIDTVEVVDLFGVRLDRVNDYMPIAVDAPSVRLTQGRGVGTALLSSRRCCAYCLDGLEILTLLSDQLNGIAVGYLLISGL